MTHDPTKLADELEQAKAVIIEANNSLFGSQSYFLSVNGHGFDKYHLSAAIESLKASHNKLWRELQELRRATPPPDVAKLREALLAARNVLHDALMPDGIYSEQAEPALVLIAAALASQDAPSVPPSDEVERVRDAATALTKTLAKQFQWDRIDSEHGFRIVRDAIAALQVKP